VDTEYYQKKWVWAVERQQVHLKQTIESNVDDQTGEFTERKDDSKEIRKGKRLPLVLNGVVHHMAARKYCKCLLYIKLNPYYKNFN
jgi:hypothetical protein